MSVARSILLAASTNAWLRERATKTAFVRRSVTRFMPGEKLEDAMAAAVTQQSQGIGSILTKLGENVNSAEEAEQVTEHYLEVIDKVTSTGVTAQISVKPTQLGLDLDRDLCLRNLIRLVDRAVERNNFVWIDMESSPYVDSTLDLFRRTRALRALTYPFSALNKAFSNFHITLPGSLRAPVKSGPPSRLVDAAWLDRKSVV